MSGKFMHNVELSGILTVIGIVLLFSSAVIVTMIAPAFVDSSWTQPTSPYQMQMYEVADPHIYFSSLRSDSTELQAVYHLEKGVTLQAFQESETTRFVSSPKLEKYITHYQAPILKLTSNLMMLRPPKGEMIQKAKKMRKSLQDQWVSENPDLKEKGLQKPAYDILELYEVEKNEAFATAAIERIVEDWVDQNYEIVDETVMQAYHNNPGVIYVNNPREYRITYFKFGKEEGWRYDPKGEPVANLEELKHHPLGFRSRKELIGFGEHLFAIEGCWYCHTDQTRTLVQDVVLNGSDSYPAPPASANEYIYQKITFAGTRRIGPDINRVGVKRPSRDWHQSHFWSPKTASKGSIMPAFQHLFDYDPRGTGKRTSSIPNYKFEALFQYLMTKGTRITPPTQAWWLGKDPIHTKEIIEGQRKL